MVKSLWVKMKAISMLDKAIRDIHVILQIKQILEKDSAEPLILIE